MTVRLDESRLRLITALGMVDETTVAEQIRLACESYVAVRLADPKLHQKTEAAIRRFRQGIAPLHGDETPIADGALGEAHPSGSGPHRDIRTEKPVTLRIDSGTVTYFTSLALLDDNTLADQLRSAVDLYVDERRRDPELEERIRQSRTDRDSLLATLSASA